MLFETVIHSPVLFLPISRASSGGRYKTMNNQAVKTREQITTEYGISRRTHYNWLKKEGIELKRRLIMPKEQKRIYAILGFPPNS